MQIWEDFVVHFNKVYVCRVFGEEWNQYLIPGRWGGLAAAGAHKVLRERVAKPDDGGAEEKGGEEKTGGAAGAGSGSGGGGTAGSGGNKYRGSRPDGDSQWFHNPQFVRSSCCILAAHRPARGCRRGSSCGAWCLCPAPVVYAACVITHARPLPLPCLCSAS